MTKIYLMTSEHFSTPGLVVRVCASRDLAVKEAIACVNIMLSDSGVKSVMTEPDMIVAINYLQGIHGAAFCYADISEQEIIGSLDPQGRWAIELVGTIARMERYDIDASDDKIEDAFATMNDLIARARQITGVSK